MGFPKKQRLQVPAIFCLSISLFYLILFIVFSGGGGGGGGGAWGSGGLVLLGLKCGHSSNISRSSHKKCQRNYKNVFAV